MATVCTLASGSTGNCILISDGNTHLLVDMGISLKKAAAGLARLQLAVSDLSGVLVTHEHSDHIKGLRTLSKRYGLPIYASGKTADAIARLVPEAADCLQNFSCGSQIQVGSVCATSFKTPHDSAESVGYRLDMDSGSVGILTDLGYVPPRVLDVLYGVDLMVLESNHDIEMLQKGYYPYYLKQRILSDRGHLSNESAADTACLLVEKGTRQFILSHLSQDNNSPPVALRAACEALTALGAKIGSDVNLQVAPVDLGAAVAV